MMTPYEDTMPFAGLLAEYMALLVWAVASVLCVSGVVRAHGLLAFVLALALCMQ